MSTIKRDVPSKHSVSVDLVESLKNIEILGTTVAALRQKVVGTMEHRDKPAERVETLVEAAALVRSRLREILEDVEILAEQL